MAVAAEAKLVFGTGLSIDGITFTPHAFNMTWNGFGALGTGKAEAVGRSPDSSGPAAMAAAFTLRTGTTDDAPVFSGTGSFAETPEGAIRAVWTVVADKAGNFAEAFVGGDIPFSRVGGGTAILDGRELPLPARRGTTPHLFRGKVSTLELRGPDGATVLRVTFDEPTAILLQDNRHWKTDDLGVRFFFATGSCEAGREYTVKVKLAIAEPNAPAPQDKVLSLSVAGPVRIVAGPDWLPLKPEPWIEPGSALDFSAVIPHHEPAGKFGRVVARGDHFEFEKLPGVPQRFYGVNLCGTANLPESREEAERFIAHLARMGYNAVRIHHHEKWLVREDGKLPDPGGSGAESPALDGTAIDGSQMNKLDLLVAACVKHGIYLTTDLYVSRGHVIPWRAIGIDKDGPVRQDSYKILCAFWEPAYSNLCAWSRNFLTHVNPYTGRSLADEPALATLALINEGNLGNFGAKVLRETPGVEEAWKQWLEGHALPTAHFPGDVNDPALALFLADAETRLFERLRDFVRDEIRSPVPLTSLAAWYDPVQYVLPRAHFDYIGSHFYVDHPQFLGEPWRLPSRCPNQNPMRGSNLGVQDCVWRRQMNKPFCITEFNYSAPGRFRGVGGIATGAMAALQDWSGLWRFAWSHARWGIVSPGGRTGYFDLANDPLSLAAERAALCLFLRGDLAPFETEEPIVLSEDKLRDPAFGAPKLASLGDSAKAWKCRVGTRLSGPAGLSAASRLSGPAGLSDNHSREATLKPRSGDLSGEAALNGVNISADGTFLIDTPCTAGGFAESGAHIAGPLRFELLPSSDDTQTVAAATVWVSSLDGKPIAQSSHLLLTHLTDVQNSGIEYADPDMTILLDWGKLPHLMRRGAAEIELSFVGVQAAALKAEGQLNDAAGGDLSREAALNGGKLVQVFRLSPGGKRVGEVPCAVSPSEGSRSLRESKGDGAATIAFTARTDLDPSTATYLYEIVRESSTP